MINPSSLKDKFAESVVKLKETLGDSNIHQLPKIKAVTINSGIGSYRANADRVKLTRQSLTKITGQIPKDTAARKSISGFKVREGEIVGLSTTLRGKRMYDFLSRLLNIYLPRRREFTGISVEQFDSQGNITLSFRDQAIFAELSNDYITEPFGVSITVTVANSSPDRSLTLLNLLGFPSRKG